MLEARDVSFYYRNRKRTPVLSHFNLTVEPGERVGLTGPSGRGKTTLCRLLAGYEKPKSGTVLLDRKSVSEYKGICPVQMIWQHPEEAVDPLLRMGDTLREAGDPDERILKELGIRPEWMTRFPSELSGGELQRFCLARALGPETEYLLCDEITAMLDLVSQARIWEFLVSESKKRNIGLLVVSHSTALLKKVCTRVVSL